jgi:hypothetical protein
MGVLLVYEKSSQLSGQKENAFEEDPLRRLEV